MDQSDQPLPAHPRGTLFLMALYGALFAVYLLIYLRRGGVTP